MKRKRAVLALCALLAVQAIVGVGRGAPGPSIKTVPLRTGGFGKLIPCRKMEVCREIANTLCPNGYLPREERTTEMPDSQLFGRSESPTQFGLVIECAPNISAKPITLRNGEQGMLIEPCRVMHDCASFASTQCPNGFIEHEEHTLQIMSADNKQVEGYQYGLVIQCEKPKATNIEDASRDMTLPTGQGGEERRAQ